jgi:hypothetical protein
MPERKGKREEPFPMTVLDGTYNIIRANRATSIIFGQFLDEPHRLAKMTNLFDFVFDPSLGRGAVKNWSEVGHYMISRLHREALGRPDNTQLRPLLERALSYPDVPEAWRQPDFSMPSAATLVIELRRGELSLKFFTTTTAFSAPLQAGLEELRVESYFPRDEITETHCKRLWELSLKDGWPN